jgi:TQXA domain-containing protein/LPXTG-motif cell wall-anchored protein
MALGAAGVAAAAPVSGVARGHAPRFIVWDTKGEKHDESQMTLAIGGGPETIAYCIDINHKIDSGGRYKEAGWNESQVANLTEIQWILAHSTPNVPDAKVLAAAGVNTSSGMGGAELHRLVYGGTQAAIWHSSDGFKLGRAENDIITKVYNYLVGQAKKQRASEPAPSLKITPESKSGPVGSRVGPFTVHSSGSVSLKARGGKLVKADGSPISGDLSDGAEFYLTNSTAGSATVEASSAGAPVPYGRVFVAADGPDKFQKVILGGVTKADVKASVSVTFAPVSATPTPSASPSATRPALPVTGASATGTIVVGVLLLAGGGLLMVMIRRRKIKFTA